MRWFTAPVNVYLRVLARVADRHRLRRTQGDRPRDVGDHFATTVNEPLYVLLGSMSNVHVPATSSTVASMNVSPEPKPNPFSVLPSGRTKSTLPAAIVEPEKLSVMRWFNPPVNVYLAF